MKTLSLRLIPLLLLFLRMGTPSTFAFARPIRSSFVRIVPNRRHENKNVPIIHDTNCPFQESSSPCDSLQQNCESTNQGRDFNRRRFFQQIHHMVRSSTFCLVSPSAVLAATPMTALEADRFSAKLERFLRKRPTQSLVRPTLDRDFAVLLMRLSYHAMDQLDCVAMDQFQRDFFLIRQAEYLPYVNELGPGFVKQGDLTDPYYFDFISFAQYATIFRDISQNPPMIFEEQQAVLEEEEEKKEEERSSNTESNNKSYSTIVAPTQRFVTRVVQRNPTMSDNTLLPLLHDQLVGEGILNRWIEIFENTTSAIPPLWIHAPDARPTTTEVLQALQQLANLFVISGFAFDATVSCVAKKQGNSSSKTNVNIDASGSMVEIQLTNPVTIWSGQALQQKGAKPTNDFYRKTAVALLKRAGFTHCSSSLRYTDFEEITTIQIGD